MGLQTVGGRSGSGAGSGGTSIKQVIRGSIASGPVQTVSVTIPTVNIAKAEVAYLGGTWTNLVPYLTLDNSTTVTAHNAQTGATTSSGYACGYQVTEWS